jgi:hypothetical protein
LIELVLLALGVTWVLAACADGSGGTADVAATTSASPTPSAAPSGCVRDADLYTTGPPPSGPPCPSARPTDGITAAIGDCWGITVAGPEGVLPCEQRHFGQVFATTTLTDAQYQAYQVSHVGNGLALSHVQATPEPALSVHDWAKKTISDFCLARADQVNLAVPYSPKSIHLVEQYPVLLGHFVPGTATQVGHAFDNAFCLMVLDQGDTTGPIIDVQSARAAAAAAFVASISAKAAAAHPTSSS